MNKNLVQLLLNYSKAQNPPWQVTDLSTYLTAFSEVMPPPAYAYLTCAALKTAYAHIPRQSALQYNIRFI